MNKETAIMIIILFLSASVYSSEIVINYTPGGLSGASDRNDLVRTNYIFDNTGRLYFTRGSIAVFRNPENIKVSDETALQIGKEKAEKARKKSYTWGVFFDLMHDNVVIDPVDIKHFEKGGMVHFYTAASGVSYKVIEENNFFAEYSLGLAWTSLYRNSFSERSFSTTDWFLKVGIGYRLKISETVFINMGIDMKWHHYSFHRMNNGAYYRFEHTGLYPYLGVGF